MALASSENAGDVPGACGMEVISISTWFGVIVVGTCVLEKVVAFDVIGIVVVDVAGMPDIWVFSG